VNWFFITLGTALVLLLSAAVVGPHFVDWTAHRATIEANASRALGTQVSVEGDAEVRLLPHPRVRLTDVRFGEADAPFLEAGTLDVDVDLAPLLRGEIRILDLRLGEPTLTLSIGEDGRLELPEIAEGEPLGGVFEAGKVSVESLVVERMRAVLLDRRTGTTATLEDVSLTGAARSLSGPFTASGTAGIGGVEQRVRIAGGALTAEDTLALSVRMVPARGDVTLGFEGTLDVSATGPRLAGEFLAEGAGETPWSIRSAMAVVTICRASVSDTP